MATRYLTYNGYTYKSGEIRTTNQGKTRESFTLDQDRIIYTWVADGFRAIKVEFKGNLTYSSDGALSSGKVTDLTTAIKFIGNTEGNGEQIASYKIASKYSDISNFSLLTASALALDGNGIASAVNFFYKSDAINDNTAPNPKYFPNSYWSNNRGIVTSKPLPVGWWNSPFSTYTITPSKSSINEGETLTTTIETTGVPKGTVVYWKLTGTAADTARFANTSASISNALTGTGTTDSNGKFQIIKSILADNKTQGATQLTVTLYSDAARTQQVGTTGITTVTVNDTSTTPAAITKQLSPSNLSDLLGRYGQEFSNENTGTSDLLGGGYGKQWSYYLSQAAVSRHGGLSQFDNAFKGVTGKSFKQASAAIDTQFTSNGDPFAYYIQALPNGLFLGTGSNNGKAIIYNGKAGKSYSIPSVGTYEGGGTRWESPQVAYKDYLYAGYTLPLGVNTQKAYLNSYNTDGSLKWSKAFAAKSNYTWIGGGHQVAILPNGNVAIAWQGNSVEKGFADSTISILRATDGSLITQNTLTGSYYVNLYCSGDGTLWGVSRNDYKTPIKILSSATAYNNSKPSDLRGDIGGFQKDGDFITTAAKKNNSSDFTTTIIKAADLPYLSTTFGNFSTTTAKDTLTGTSFADTFAFSTAPNYSSNGSTSDVITNFNPTEGDLIKLSKSAFGISSGGLSPTFAQVNSASALTTQLGSTTQIVYDQSTGFLYNNQDGSLTNGCGSGGGIFAVLTGKPTLSSGNLQFI